MKRLKKNNYTLTELMFVIAILIIITGIGFVASGKIFRDTAKAQAKAELKMLHAAVKAYKARYGFFPNAPNTGTSNYSSDLNFVEWLSKVPPDNADYTGDKRDMFAPFRASAINLDTDNYDSSYRGNGNSTPPTTTATDPYENTYKYYLQVNNSTNYEDDTFYILSEGLDAVLGGGDDLRSDQLNE